MRSSGPRSISIVAWRRISDGGPARLWISVCLAQRIRISRSNKRCFWNSAVTDCLRLPRWLCLAFARRRVSSMVHYWDTRWKGTRDVNEFCENGTQTIPQLTSANHQIQSKSQRGGRLHSVLAHTIFQFIGIFVRKGRSLALAKRLARRLNGEEV